RHVRSARAVVSPADGGRDARAPPARIAGPHEHHVVRLRHRGVHRSAAQRGRLESGIRRRPETGHRVTVSPRGMLPRCGPAVWIGLAVMLIASVSQGATDPRVVWDWGANLPAPDRRIARRADSGELHDATRTGGTLALAHARWPD